VSLMQASKQPGQFGLLALFGLITVVAITVGLLRLPVPPTEKCLSLSALWHCYWCWRNRKYLHPLQGTIAAAARRKIARMDFLQTMLGPTFLIAFYALGWRGTHPIWFTDVISVCALALTVAIATRKLLIARRWQQDAPSPWPSTAIERDFGI
jgi:hypothetical protein